MRPSSLLRGSLASYILLVSFAYFLFADVPYSWFYYYSSTQSTRLPSADPAADRPKGIRYRDLGIQYLASGEAQQHQLAATSIDHATRGAAAAVPGKNRTSLFGPHLFRSVGPLSLKRHTRLAVAVQSVSRPDGADYLTATIGSLLRSLRHVPPELYQVLVVNGNAVAADHTSARQLAAVVPVLEYDPAELARLEETARATDTPTSSEQGPPPLLRQQRNETAMYAHILDRLAQLCDYALVLEDDVVSDDSLAGALARILGPDFDGDVGVDMDDWQFILLYFTEKFMGFCVDDIPFFVVICVLLAVVADIIILDLPSLLFFLIPRRTEMRGDLEGNPWGIVQEFNWEIDDEHPSFTRKKFRSWVRHGRRALVSRLPSWRYVERMSCVRTDLARRLLLRAAAIAVFLCTVVTIPLMIGRQNIMLFRRVPTTTIQFTTTTPVYSPPSLEQPAPPGYLVETDEGCCTQAMLFRSPAIPEVVTYLWSNDIRARVHVDVALDEFVKHRQRKRFLHVPSVFQHMGIKSTADDRPVPHMSASFETSGI